VKSINVRRVSPRTGEVGRLYIFTINKDPTPEYVKFLYENSPSIYDDVQEGLGIIKARIERAKQKGTGALKYRDEIGASKALPFETSILRLYCHPIKNTDILLVGNGGIKVPDDSSENKNKLKDHPELHEFSSIVDGVGAFIESGLADGTLQYTDGDIVGLTEFTIV
jgi:hypothetical protein